MLLVSQHQVYPRVRATSWLLWRSGHSVFGYSSQIALEVSVIRWFIRPLSLKLRTHLVLDFGNGELGWIGWGRLIRFLLPSSGQSIPFFTENFLKGVVTA